MCRQYLKDRVSETLGLLYAPHFPFRQKETSRGVRKSPFHEALKGDGACFGELSGWERPNWFLPADEADKGKKAEYEYSWWRQNWFGYSADEHAAIREKVHMEFIEI